MKKDNKGLTLIELVVTIAIIGIFSGVVLTFIGTGANSYRNTSNNAEAQMEVQQALDQIQDIVIDVNRGVYYASVGEGISVIDRFQELDKLPLTEKVNDIDKGDGQSKAFFVTSAVPKEGKEDFFDFFCEIVQWNSQSKNLEYGVWTWEAQEPFVTEEETILNPDGKKTFTSRGEGKTAAPAVSATKPVPTVTPEAKVYKTIVAKDITRFEVDISKATDKKVVRFQLVTDKRGKTIKTLHTVNLRNQVQIAKPVIHYDSLRPEKAELIIINKPGSLKMNEPTEGFGVLHPNIKTITWKIEETDCAVFERETTESPVITVIKYPVKGYVTVYVEGVSYTGTAHEAKKVKIPVERDKDKYQLTLTEETGKSSSVIYDNEKVTLTAKLMKNGQEVTDAPGVAWTCTLNDNPVKDALTGSGSERIFSLPKDKKVAGEYLVTVSYTTDSGETLTDTYPIIVKTIRASIVFDEGNDTTFFPGEERYFKLVLRNEKNENIEAESITWKLEPASESQSSVELGKTEEIKKDTIDFDQKYTAPVVSEGQSKDTILVKLTAEYTLKDNKTGTTTVELYITPLKMILIPNPSAVMIQLNHTDANGEGTNTDPVIIRAELRDATNNNVPDLINGYNVSWEIDPKDSVTDHLDAYTITNTKGGQAELHMDKNKLQVGTDTIVVNAVAKKDSKPVCAATTSVTITVSEKKLYTKHYYCKNHGEMQELIYDGGVDESDFNSCTIEGDKDGILIKDKETIPQKVGIKEPSFKNLNYIIKMTVDFKDKTYVFFIHPVRFNNVIEPSLPLPFFTTFLPYKTDAIREYGELSKDGYTYICKDTGGVRCELRLSIRNETMIGKVSNWWESSMNRWFMEREGKLYEYSLGTWHTIKADEDYWNLNEKAPTEPGQTNKIYWQKWR